MTITLNNTNHQVTMGKGKNGMLKFAIDGSEKKSFKELQETMKEKATNDKERESAMRFMRIPDEILQQTAARLTKQRIFNKKWELAQAGNFDARNDLKGLFHKFGLDRFLTHNMSNTNNFVTNLLSMTQRERAAFIKLEEYVFNNRSW